VKKWELDLSKWSLATENDWAGSIEIKNVGKGVYLSNTGKKTVVLRYEKDIVVEEKEFKSLCAKFYGENIRNDSACFYINGNPVALNEMITIDIQPPISFHLMLDVPSESALQITKIELEAHEVVKKWELDLATWTVATENGWSGTIERKRTNKGVYLSNTGENTVVLHYKQDISIEERAIKGLRAKFYGENLKNGGACFYINGHPVTLNGTVSMELQPPINLHLTIGIPSNSTAEIAKIELEALDKLEDLSEQCSEDADVLVITPDYPSTHNLYLSAFAHSRNREYVKAGLKVQVAAVNRFNWYQSSYTMDGVPVFTGKYLDLKKLLSRHQYKVIVTHFVDEYLYPIFDGYVQDERLIFICHGPEATFRFLTNRCRPYFTKELPEIDQSEGFNAKEAWARKYAQKDNVDWVFVSEFLHEFSEKMLGVTFRNHHIIYNTINEQLFPYKKKTAEDRKKILIMRKFDNIRVHSIDQIVGAIQSLSRRDFFDDLSFEIYGDGSNYDVLTKPLTHFHNVNLHRTFVPNNEIHKIHAENGVLLIPSRHDAHAVAMGEGASSGLVVVGSNVTSNGFFMNQEVNHTLADPDDPHALADIIERLYRNPDEYLEISERMSRETQARCNRENTVMKEVALICEKIKVAKETKYQLTVKPDKDPVLTIVVPAYNVEAYLDKCVRSLLNHRNVQKTEIIVVNDGSKDGTLKIAKHYEKVSNGIVRVIDKENGGHGSTINSGLAAARGRYFRLIDGDDWVDGENLAKLVDRLENETVDIVLTKGSYEYVEQAELVNIVDYDMLIEGTTYYFDDLLYPGYGFDGYGPLLTTGNYRTEVLKKAQFKISEKKPYVDMEFNSFSLRYVETLKYYDLDIYRYLIGREGQTVSRDFWKKKYRDHEYVILNILDTIHKMENYPEKKKKYVYEHIVAPMIDSQVFMFDQLCLWEEIDNFFGKLETWPDALEAGRDLIKKKNGDCAQILLCYRAKLEENAEKRSPIVGGTAPVNVTVQNIEDTSPKKKIKKLIKACIPHGILRIYQKKRYPNGI